MKRIDDQKHFLGNSMNPSRKVLCGVMMTREAFFVLSDGQLVGIPPQGRVERRGQPSRPAEHLPRSWCGRCRQLALGRGLPTSSQALPHPREGRGRGWERREGPWRRELGFLSECGNAWGREGMNGKCVNE